MTRDERIKVITLREAEWSWTKIGNYLNIDRRTCQKVNKDAYYSNLKGYYSSLKGLKELEKYGRANKEIIDLSAGKGNRHSFKPTPDRPAPDI